MASLSIFSFLCGAVLGMRLKIFVLLPFFAIGGALIVAVGLLSGIGPSRTAGAFVAFVMSLQLGYLLPVLVRWGARPLLAPATPMAIAKPVKHDAAF